MQMELSFPAKRFVAMAMTMIIFLSSVVTVVATTVTATVVDGGKSHTLQVLTTGTEDILNQAGIELDGSDLVERNDSHGIVITVRRGFYVTVSADGKSESVLLHTGDTVKTALQKVRVTLDADDLVNIPLAQTAEADMEIEVTRQYPVDVLVDGRHIRPVLKEGTVGDALKDALKKAGIVLGDEDIITPDPDTEVSAGLVLTVKRVTYREVETTEPVPHTTIRQETDTMAEGTSRVTKSGENGERTIVSREKLIDGVVYEREEISSAIIKQPVAQVMLVGTKAAAKKVSAAAKTAASTGGTLKDKDGNTVKYSKYLTGRCTAYTATGARTSTGKKAQYGYIAVDPKVIPYGTKLYVASPNGKTVYGYAVAADTGGAMLSGRILADLYYDTKRECVNFGVRNMRLYVLD